MSKRPIEDTLAPEFMQLKAQDSTSKRIRHSSELDSSQDHLCSKCAAIDFDAAYRLTYEELGPTGKPITGHRYIIDKECQLCAMVQATLNTWTEV